MRNKILLIVSIALLLAPISVFAEQTVSEYEAETQKLIAELQTRKDKIAKNDAEVAQIKKNIVAIENQIKQTQAEIDILQKEIEESNKKIIKKSKESKQIMAYYQIANGDNAYLEYAFGAETITDMIYRVSIVEQLTEYNDQIMKELQQLIAENNRKKGELSTKKEELNSLKDKLQSEKDRIEEDTAKIKVGMPSLEQQLSSAKQSLQTLKNMGCKANETISSCQARLGQGGASVPSTNGLFRPTTYGNINQYYKGCGGWNGRTCTSGHMGVDIGSGRKEIPIYPIAAGKISSKYSDPAGALVIRVKHNVNGQILYSTYAHLSRFASVKVGDYVTADTRIGDMGTTGNSSGIHLHLEVSTCDWNTMLDGDWKCSWSYYATSSIRNPASYVSLPSSWNNR